MVGRTASESRVGLLTIVAAFAAVAPFAPPISGQTLDRVSTREEVLAAVIQATQHIDRHEYDAALASAYRILDFSESRGEPMLHITAVSILAMAHGELGDTLLAAAFGRDGFRLQLDMIKTNGIRGFSRASMHLAMDIWSQSAQLAVSLMEGAMGGVDTDQHAMSEIAAWGRAVGTPRRFRQAYIQYQKTLLDTRAVFSPDPTVRDEWLARHRRAAEEAGNANVADAAALGDTPAQAAAARAAMLAVADLYAGMARLDRPLVDRAVDALWDAMDIIGRESFGLPLDEALTQGLVAQRDALEAMLDQMTPGAIGGMVSLAGAGQSDQATALHFMRLDPTLEGTFTRYAYPPLRALRPHREVIVDSARAFRRRLARSGDLQWSDPPRILPQHLPPTYDFAAIAAAVQLEGQWLFTEDPVDLRRAEATIAVLREREQERVLPARTRRSPKLLVLALRDALVQSHLGRLDEAAERMTEAVRLADLEGPAIAWQMHLWLGLLERLRGNPTAAIASLESAAGAAEDLRSSIRDVDLRGRVLDRRLIVYDLLIELLVENGDHARALLYMEQAKARSFLDRLSQPQHEPVHDARGREYPDYLRALQRERYGDPEFDAMASADVLGPEAIRRYLKPGTVLLNYFVSGKQIHIGIVEAGRDPVVVSRPYEWGTLQREISSYREAIARRLDHRALGESLWGAFFPDSVQNRIRGKKIVIVPHGLAHYVPMHALLHNGRYVFQDHQVSYLPSASTLAYLEPKRRAARASGALIVANPDGTLLFAEEEALAIQRILGEGKILRRDASVATVSRLAPGNAILHFATHAQLDPDNPVRSRLVLAGGDLTVGDIFGLRLDARLVTLSACNTSVGRLSNGDELVGLTRAFLFAGTPLVAATLWKADEESTPALMTAFYRELESGADPAAAIQTAMDQVSAQSEFAHPYFWAPFVLVGYPY